MPVGQWRLPQRVCCAQVAGSTLRHWGVALLGGVVFGVGGLVADVQPAGAGPDRSSGTVSWVTNQVSFEPIGPTGEAVPFIVGSVGSYRGSIEVGRGTGGLAVVNDVGLEDYVQGIAEVPPTWPAAAEEAQAIAARTYVLHEEEQPPSGPLGAQICATDACQVYVGLAREREAGDAGWAAAVKATAGQVVEYGGQPILAMYSSSNGGHTVAGSEPYLWSVPDRQDAASSPDNFRLSVPLVDLAGVFGLPGRVTGVTQQGDLVTLTWQVSPAIHMAPSTSGPSGPSVSPAPTATPSPSRGQLQLGSDSFRQKVDSGLTPPPGFSQTLPSDRFQITISGSDMIVTGGGRGHGIGLSQYGALGKALEGQSASQILADYYGGLRPSAPGHLAPSVRVSLADGMGQVPVSGPTPFQVVDGQGHRLAVATTGAWQVVPGPRPGSVRVIAAPGQGGTPSLGSVVVDQGGLGQPAQVRFRVSAPAAVRATEQRPSGQGASVDVGLVAGGDFAVNLPPSTMNGAYQVRLTADAGGGRVTTVALSFRVGPGSTSSSGPTISTQSGRLSSATGPVGDPMGRTRQGESGTTRWAATLGALAALALAAVVTRVGRTRRAASTRRLV